MADEAKKTPTKAKATVETKKYTKEAVIDSGEFKVIERDLLKALLKDDESYEINDAKKVIENYKKGAIK
ncbi:hypothetical protein ACRCJU_01915 [Aerococcus urinaeequi]|uniref:hypothetical protein n=1 Tax=Aerococcus urinaeequi TaxID=51665 RepID=UPI003D6A044C